MSTRPVPYCRECDVFEHHNHNIGPALVSIAVALVYLGPALLVALWLTGFFDAPPPHP